MIGWLWRMLVGRFTTCPHVWAHESTTRVMEDYDSSIPLYHKYILRCKTCGDYKSKKL